MVTGVLSFDLGMSCLSLRECVVMVWDGSVAVIVDACPTASPFTSTVHADEGVVAVEGGG
jgi:hypothetical protein